MRLTRLEIFGFKSFVERFVLNFDKNKIGIVGPNGCGKSNIVDALRWVLGETYAKQLRGNVLEDLIFNGSETRRPLGMAEVIITIRPDSGWSDNLNLDSLKSSTEEAVNEGISVDEASPSLDVNEDGTIIPAAPSEEEDLEKIVLPLVLREIPGLLNASEIQFTRRLYRSGESEYFINRVPCRLRDMIDVFRVIGLGARGLSIVQQGEIGQFISKKPVERRELLEEAAGISGFRNRMEVAQRKLEKTAENMDRLRDIMEEVDKQVRVLKRQATRARERNELKASILREDIAVFRAKRVRLSMQRGTQASQLASMNEKFVAAKTAMLGAESRQSELSAELEEYETLIGDKRRVRDSLQLAFERERERVQRLEVSRIRAQGEIAATEREREQIELRRTQLADEVTRIVQRSEELRSQVEEAVAKRDQAQSALAGLQTDEGRKQALEVDLSKARDAVPESLRHEIHALEQQVGRMLGVETELKELERQSDAKRRELDEGRKQLHGIEIKLTSVDSEVRSLNKQLEALAEQVVRATGDGRHQPQDPNAGVRKVLLAGLRVPENAQRAVSAILGEKAQYLVAEDIFETAKGFNERQRHCGEKAGRIGVIHRGATPKVEATLMLEAAEREAAPSARPLLELLSVDAELQSVVRHFLGQFVFVETLEEAIRLAEIRRETAEPERWIVTAAGEVFTPWGWYTTEGKGAAFSFTRRIEEMEGLKRELERDREALQARVQEHETRAAEIFQAREALVLERRELSEGDRRLSALHRQMLEIERHERDRLLAQSRLRQEQFLREEREAQERLRSSVAAVARLQQEEESCAFRAQQVEEEQERCSSMLQSVGRRDEELRLEASRLGEEIERGILLEGEMTLPEFQERCETLDRELRELGAKREPVRLAISELAADVAENRRTAQDIEERIRAMTLSEERLKLELEMLIEDLRRQHPDSEECNAAASEPLQQPLRDEAEALRELGRLSGDASLMESVAGLDEHLQTTQESLQRLRKRLEREGEVDPQSIELYEQENARLSGMQTQYADLEEARRILESTIRRLKEISRKRFLETFTAVNKRFQELIPRLFGGGAGHLELLNPEDPLASGVELMVRPPGKRLGSMELMSGGEKALVAISVLISMFLHRPSPICVLDEVDAPLDEANLERYLGLISEISRKTQFLVITHNKRTMAEADRLIGITMQEKGVSTALSVALEDAPEILNRGIGNAGGESAPSLM